jgi:hypothetical protein
MTQKDFVLIAATIRELPYHELRAIVADAFADKLAADNPRFKRDLFLKACQP